MNLGRLANGDGRSTKAAGAGAVGSTAAEAAAVTNDAVETAAASAVTGARLSKDAGAVIGDSAVVEAGVPKSAANTRP